MESKTPGRSFLPVLLIFIITNAILVVFPAIEMLWGMSRMVMVVGNAILFAATAVSFYLYQKSLRNNNVHAFLRMIYGGMFAKMMICLFAAVIYIVVAKKNVSKGAVFGLMFLYFVYTFVEISIILKLSRKERYAKERGAA
jgi:RsiW-degrading membrane proteinase PrsW (M82 family)